MSAAASLCARAAPAESATDSRSRSNAAAATRCVASATVSARVRVDDRLAELARVLRVARRVVATRPSPSVRYESGLTAWPRGVVGDALVVDPVAEAIERLAEPDHAARVEPEQLAHEGGDAARAAPTRRLR